MGGVDRDASGWCFVTCGVGDKRKHRIWGRDCFACSRGVLRYKKDDCNIGNLTYSGSLDGNASSCTPSGGKKNRAAVFTMLMLRILIMSVMVKKLTGKTKGSFTVEAAMICPLICLIICGMLVMTLKLYQNVNLFSKELKQRQEQSLSSADLIRMEAVAEELF